MKHQLGGAMADLVAHIFALLTENEKGSLLEQRKLDIKATLSSISAIVGDWHEN